MSMHRAGSPVANSTETTEQAIQTQEAYRQRISDLREYGAEDGLTINPVSEAALWQFVNSHPHWRKDMTELLPNGNLRAVWKDGQGGHLGLQFFGGTDVEYVLFQPRPEEGKVHREAGLDTFDGIDRRVSSLTPLTHTIN